MKEADDPLEAELAALRPREPSPGLQRRIAERLAANPFAPASGARSRGEGALESQPPHPYSSPPKRGRGGILERWQRLRGIALVSGLAAACLAAGILLGRWGPGVETKRTTAPASHALHGPIDDSLPTLQAYRHALARSPDELDALLDKHASHPDPSGARIGAFPRSDAEIHALIGER